jgi:hypothetical protein
MNNLRLSVVFFPSQPLAKITREDALLWYQQADLPIIAAFDAFRVALPQHLSQQGSLQHD